MKPWRFDAAVADVFEQHARQHIPNYDIVIDKCVDLCLDLLPMDAPIIDVGCATGLTLCRLHAQGFTNLTGIDNSADMLARCPPNIATWLLGDRFPAQSYHAVLCNWTLHFMQDKISYLASMYQGIEPGGFLVLSDKTSEDPVPLQQYHEFKRRNHVSEQDIRVKHLSLQGVINIDPVDWYITQLRDLGFRDVYVIDASWCFTTFLGMK